MSTAGACPGTLPRLSLRSAETVCVNLVRLAEPTQPLDFARQRIEPLRHVCQGQRLPIRADGYQRAHGLRLELQHQFLRPGQLGLYELEVVLRELGPSRRRLHRIVERP